MSEKSSEDNVSGAQTILSELHNTDRQTDKMDRQMNGCVVQTEGWMVDDGWTEKMQNLRVLPHL